MCVETEWSVCVLHFPSDRQLHVTEDRQPTAFRILGAVQFKRRQAGRLFFH